MQLGCNRSARLQSIRSKSLMDDLLIFPFGGNGREALAAICAQNAVEARWNVLGFLDDDERHRGQEFSEVPVLGGRHLVSDYPNAFILAVPGNPHNFQSRAELISSLEVPEHRYATIIDPTVRVAPDASIGANVLLMANAFVSVSTRVGNHCVVLPNTVISHDTTVDDYTLIGSNVSISGSCSIGRNCYIGSGVRIRERLQVGDQALVGLGSTVIENVAAHSVVAGTPARPLPGR